ncbi:hypothetical protein [Varibaculum cambriense]
MDVVESLLNKMITPFWIRGFYQVLASLIALLAIAAFLGQGVVHPSDTNQMEAFLAFQGTPLAVLYKVLELFSVPTGWIEDVTEYIAASTQRAQVIGIFAAIIGLAVSFFLVPDPDANSAPAPSVQASTWWIAFATTMQTDINEGFFNDNSSFMLVWLALLWGFYEIRSRFFHKGMHDRCELDVVQLGVAVLYFARIFIPLIFSGHPKYRSNNTT